MIYSLHFSDTRSENVHSFVAKLQSGKLIEVMLVRSVRTARRTDESCCASIRFCGEEFLRWRRTSTGVDSGEAFTATATALRC